MGGWPGRGGFREPQGATPLGKCSPEHLFTWLQNVLSLDYLKKCYNSQKTLKNC